MGESTKLGCTNKTFFLNNKKQKSKYLYIKTYKYLFCFGFQSILYVVLVLCKFFSNYNINDNVRINRKNNIFKINIRYSNTMYTKKCMLQFLLHYDVIEIKIVNNLLNINCVSIT